MKVNKTALATAITAALCSSHYTHAQDVVGQAANTDAENPFGDEVLVVTGSYRTSLIGAINTKRNSSSVVEAVSAEDIGKLPDSSIAESLARLPGVAGERRGGRTSGISVRGFREDFVGTTMNGRELLGIGDNRGVEYDLYPSEIMTGAVVYKASDASLSVQGIGGTVDLRTARPLEVNRTLTLNGSWEQNAEDSPNPDFDADGNRLAFSYIDQFADDKIGVALAIASTESPLHARKFSVWGYSPDEEGLLAPDGFNVFAESKVLERDTISLTLQFNPTDSLDITVDALDIDFSDSGVERGFIELLGVDASTPSTNNGQLYTSGTSAPWNATQMNRPIEKEGELQQLGINIQWQASDNFSVKLDASSSETSKKDLLGESYAGLGRAGMVAGDNPVVRSWSLTSSGLVFDGGDPRHADPDQLQIAGTQAWGGGLSPFSQIQDVVNDFYAEYPVADADDDGIADDHGLYFVNDDGSGSIGFANAQDGFNNIALFEESLDSLRLEGEYSFFDGFLTAVSGGVIYSSREKSKDNTGFFLTNSAFPGSASNPSGALSASDYYVGQTDLSFSGLGSLAAYDVSAIDYIQSDASLSETNRVGDTYVVEEDVTTLFGKVEFGADFNSANIYGNAGVQVIETDQKARGFDGILGSDGLVVRTDASGGDSYTKVLPSLNLNVAFDDQNLLRLAASKTMSRARFDFLRPGRSITYSFDIVTNQEAEDPTKGPWSATSGNPMLRPYESNNFEISYENYFANDGVIAVAVFHKDLVNWHRGGVEIIDFSDFYIPGLHQAVDSTGTVFEPQLFTGTSTIREDGLSGSLDGVELSVSLPFSVLHQSLDGLGIVGSYSHNDGELDDGGKIPGMSEDVWSLTTYYGIGGFEARVSVTDRSEFESEARGGSNSIVTTNRVAAQLIDAQISYDFNGSGIDWLEGLRVSLQAQNLGDEDETNVLAGGGSPLLITSNQQYGANYLLNFNYSFF